MRFPEKPLGLFDIFYTAYRLWRDNFFKVAWVSIICALITTVYTEHVITFSIKDLFSLKLSELYNLWQVSIASMMTLFSYTLIFNMLNPQLSEQSRLLIPSLKRTIKQFPTLLVLGFATSIITSIGYLLFAIPGIYLFILFSLTIPLKILDNLATVTSVKASMELVNNNWWRTAGIFASATLLYWFCVLGLNHVMAPGNYHNLFSMHAYQFIYTILTIIALGLAMPLFVEVIILYINDLKLRKQPEHTALVGH